MTPEGKVQSECVKWLEELGLGYVFRLSDSVNAGYPDYVYILDGLFIGIEFKREKGGRQSLPQKKFMENVTKKGHGAYMVIESLSQLKADLQMFHDAILSTSP